VDDLFDRDDKELIRQVQFGKISTITGPVIMKTGLGIVPSSKPPKETNIKAIDKSRAMKLYRGIKVRGGTDHRTISKYWPHQFAGIRFIRNDMERIDKVLEWMEKGDDQKQIKWIHSPNQFVKALDELETLAGQWKPFPLHPRSKDIVARLMRQSYSWPIEVTKEDIETFLTNSLACQYAVRCYLKTMEKEFNRLANMFPYSDDFVEHWYEITASMANEWSEFSGPLTKWAITLTSKRYRKEMVSVIAPLLECSRSDAEKAWDEIIEGVINAQK
jgi:hypothetical protein